MHFFDEKKEKLSNLVQELQLRKGSHKEQLSYIYEGIEGVKAAFNNAVDFLSKGDEICVFSMGKELATEKLRRFWDDHFKKRNAKGIKTRAIPHISLKEIFPKYYSRYKINFRFSSLSLPLGTFLYRDHVLTPVWGEKPVAFVIKSEKVYNNYIKFFETIWKKSKKY
jgi:sugar-specific transcriptional regulator TrmB